MMKFHLLTLKKLGAMSLSALMALSLTACSQSSETKFTYAIADDITSFDPSNAADGGSLNGLKIMSEGLMTFDKKGNDTYGMADSVKKSKDGLTYTFHIRNAKWSNGAAVTADDFVYAWQRIFQEKGSYAYMFGSSGIYLKNADQLLEKSSKGKLTQKDLDTLGVKAKGKKTLIVTLGHTVPYFLKLISYPCFMPINRAFAKKVVSKFGKSPDAILSNGPYKLVKWTKSSSTEYVKNKNYWNAKAVHIDRLRTMLLQTSQGAAASYESGKIQMFNVDSSLVDKYKNKKGFTNYSTGFMFYLLLNLKNKALNNKNIRLALSYAINRKDFATSILKDGSTAATGFVPPKLATSPKGTDFRSDAGSYKDLSYDQAKAQKYLNKGLKEIGKSKLKLRLLYGTDEIPMPKLSTYLQQSFTKLKGLEIEVQATTRQDRVNNRQKNGNFDISITRWGPDYADPTTYLNLFTKDNTNNFGGYESAAYNKEMTLVHNETNETTRWNEMIKAEKILMKDLPIIPVFNQGGGYIINPEYTGFLRGSIMGSILTYVQKK